MKRLSHIVLCSQVKSLQNILLQVIGSKKDHRKLRLDLLDLPAQIKAASIRKIHIQKRQGKGIRLQKLARLSAAVGSHCQVSRAVQFKTKTCAKRQVVFYN